MQVRQKQSAEADRVEVEGDQPITVEYRWQAGIDSTGAAASRLASTLWHNETKGAAK
jgi:hypothetical protein